MSVRLLAAFALAVLPAAARAGDDVQIWASAIAQGPIETGSRVKPMLWLEVQSRFANDVSQLGTFILRPGVGLRFGPDLHIIFGYQFQQNSPLNGRETSEHRMWEQVTVPLYRDPERLILLARLRLEQRSTVGAQDLGWRGRAMLRAQIPLNGRGSAGPLLWSEAFVGFNDTDWGQRSGLRQVRAFAGGLIPLGKRLNFEAGYMARFDRGPGNDHVSHVANLALNYRLGN